MSAQSINSVLLPLCPCGLLAAPLEELSALRGNRGKKLDAHLPLHAYTADTHTHPDVGAIQS